MVCSYRGTSRVTSPNPSIEQTVTLTSEKQHDRCDSSPFSTLFSPLLRCCWSPFNSAVSAIQTIGTLHARSSGSFVPQRARPLAPCLPASLPSPDPLCLGCKGKGQPCNSSPSSLPSSVVRPPESDDVVPIPCASRPHGVQQSSPNNPSILNWPRLSRPPAHRPSCRGGPARS